MIWKKKQKKKMDNKEKITTMNIPISGIQSLEELKEFLSLVLPSSEISVDNFGEVLIYTGLKVRPNE